MIYFEWGYARNAKNLRDHGVDFEEASLVFDDEFRITEEDSVVDGEQRWRTIGTSFGVTVLLVAHLEGDFGNDLVVRIISARKTTPQERSDYDCAQKAR